MAAIEFDEVDLVVGGVRVLDAVSFEVEDESLTAIIGPSGSGKSSLLRLVSGLTTPTAGTVRIGGVPVDCAAPWRNRVAMVFQDDSLYEHLTVGSNLEFPWMVQGNDRAEAARQAHSVAARVGISRLWARRPRTLSGGQRGQVATARALSRDRPSVVLLDEPLSRADAGTRRRFRTEIRRLHQEFGVTMLLATNDQTEAMSLATRFAVIADGRVHQTGSPIEVYEHPVNTTVAAFVGERGMNLIPARALPSGDAVEVGDDRVRLDPIPSTLPARVLVGLHPSEIQVAPAGTPFERTIHATIGHVEDLGSKAIVSFGLGRHRGAGYSMEVSSGTWPQVGDRLELTWTRRTPRLFDVETGLSIGC